MVKLVEGFLRDIVYTCGKDEKFWELKWYIVRLDNLVRFVGFGFIFFDF